MFHVHARRYDPVSTNAEHNQNASNCQNLKYHIFFLISYPDEKAAEAGPAQTRLLTNSAELNAGIGGAIIGAGGALLISHLINEDKKKKCRYTRSADDSPVQSRLFGLGGEFSRSNLMLTQHAKVPI